MKILHKGVYKWLLAASSITLVSSCSKSFLHEEQITAVNADEYKTQLGIDKLVIGMYESYRFPFGWESGYTAFNYGTDEFGVGGAGDQSAWNDYNLTSQTNLVATYWDEMYSTINTANIIVQNTPLYYTAGTTANTRLGEGYFTRAWSYFNLVQQYGGVPLLTIPNPGVPQYEYTRASAKDVYAQIISDFTKAYSLLPAKPEAQGRISKWAAAHFLAKAYLFRASELYADWNADTKQDDLSKAVTYSTDVINNSPHKLATNFSDLWNYTGPDAANESNAEIIFAAQYNTNASARDRTGNTMHLYFLSVITGKGIVRDMADGREYSRLRTTDYMMDVYDRVNDSRFWKSFRTENSCNTASGVPVWGDNYAPSPELAGTPRFTLNDPALMYIINNTADNRFVNAAYADSAFAPVYKVRYLQGSTVSFVASNGQNDPKVFPSLSKYVDGSREGTTNTYGFRDGTLARLGETYLIAAEAYGRQGNYDMALTYINAIRDRAAYKAGEDRSFYVDGGVAYKNNAVGDKSVSSYSSKNTYYESNNIDETTDATSLHLNSASDMFASAYEFYDKLNAGSNTDKFIAFILNERSRELAGELVRWPDLARTKTLVTRAKLFNGTAIPLENKHYLRPIPQTFLDQVQSNGQSLTDAQKKAMQNPNY